VSLLDAAVAAGVRRFVFASSSSVYGTAAELPKREDMPALPVSPYAVAKLACEGYCRSFGEVYGLETVALRYFNVFGPRQDPRSQYAAVVPNFIAALLTHQRPMIFGDGAQSRDFTYVENVIDANLRAMAADVAPGGVYNVACGEAVTLNQLVAELQQLTESDVEPVYAAPRAGDVRHSLADLTRSRKELGYVPSVGLREGLRRSIEHLRERMRSGELAPSP
jgi:nucleoside-diphosphate-sugar epimerase